VNRMVFARIEQRTVQGAVVDVLRDAIISGVLEPGERLTESAIAQQMAVSRAPLREALRQLEQEGLVERIPNRGCFVTQFSEHDVVEVFTLRATLESMAIRLAIPNLTADDFIALHTLIDQSEQAVRLHDLDALTDKDMEFHEYICRKAGHGRLLKAWYTHSAQCRMLLNSRFRTMSDYTPETVVRDHGQILDALQHGDADAAIALTEQISQRVQKECIEIVKRRRQAATSKNASSTISPSKGAQPVAAERW